MTPQTDSSLQQGSALRPLLLQSSAVTPSVQITTPSGGGKLLTGGATNVPINVSNLPQATNIVQTLVLI